MLHMSGGTGSESEVACSVELCSENWILETEMQQILTIGLANVAFDDFEALILCKILFTSVLEQSCQ